MDFLRAIHPKQGVEVFSQWIPRAKFGNHVRLGQLSQVIDAAFASGQSGQAARSMDEYFEITGFSPVGLSGEELIVAYGKLSELNQLKWILAYQTWQTEPTDPPPYTYPNRQVAWIVHKLASRYGWTRSYILDELWPEEVSAYVQEILVSEFEEIDQARSLTELGYHYDSTTKKSTFRPITKPLWYTGEPERKTYRIKKELMPVGHIIKLEDLAGDVIH